MISDFNLEALFANLRGTVTNTDGIADACYPERPFPLHPGEDQVIRPQSHKASEALSCPSNIFVSATKTTGELWALGPGSGVSRNAWV